MISYGGCCINCNIWIEENTVDGHGDIIIYQTEVFIQIILKCFE